MKIVSGAFEHGGAIPRRHACDGEDVSPPLAWTEVPASAKSVVLLVEDPDAPDPAAPKTTWVHWVLYDLPPGTGFLEEGVAATALPPGTRQGINDWKRAGYGGPCPPVGRHRYFFRAYALDTRLGDLGRADKAKVEEAMRGHVVAHAELVGTYER